jgi:hypothetical protein
MIVSKLAVLTELKEVCSQTREDKRQQLMIVVTISNDKSISCFISSGTSENVTLSVGVVYGEEIRPRLVLEQG